MPAENVSEEIRHLMRDKNFSQRRAIAAAKSMERAGKFKKHAKKKRRKSAKSRRRTSSKY
jgi:hypothetical protein